MPQRLSARRTGFGPHFVAVVLVATLLATGFPVGLPPAQAQIGLEALVVDQSAGTGLRGALFRVDSTGNRTLLTDFGDAAQGPTGSSPQGVTFDTVVNAVVVVDRDAGTNGQGALFRVDNTTGVRTLLSDFGDAGQGPLGVNPSGVAQEGPGRLLVVDPDAGTNGQGALFRVDNATGARTLLSDFGQAGQGPTGASPTGVAVDTVTSGSIVVVDPGAGTNGQGGLFAVDAATGARTLLSDFGSPGQGPTGNSPTGVSLDLFNSGLAVVDPDAGTGLLGALFLVDPVTGARTLFSDFGNPAQGPTGDSPVGVDFQNGPAVIDSQAGTGGHGALFVPDPATGERRILSDFGDATQGPLGVRPVGVIVGLVCPILVALEKAPNGKAKLGILYDIRDKVLAKTPAGQRYTRLFYTHALEGAWLMVRHPELRARTRTLIERVLPTFQAMLAGQSATMRFADLLVADGLLQAFAEKAGANLRADLRAIQTELRQGTLLRQFGIGLTLWK